MRPERLLECYPKAWRERYGDELLACITDSVESERNVPVGLAARIAWAGLRERAHANGLIGIAADADTRVRSGGLTVLTGWAVFVVAGAAFAKRTEDAGDGTARAAVQILAIAAGLAIIAGGCAVAPALVRYLRAGGWSAHRRLFATALSVTTLAVASTLALVGLARTVPESDRVNGAGWYGIAFSGWCLTVVATIGCWIAVSWVLGHQLALTRPTLVVEGAVVGVTAAAMLAMSVVVGIVVVAGTPGSTIANGGLILATMVAADAIASFGLSRVWAID